MRQSGAIIMHAAAPVRRLCETSCAFCLLCRARACSCFVHNIPLRFRIATKLGEPYGADSRIVAKSLMLPHESV